MRWHIYSFLAGIIGIYTAFYRFLYSSIIKKQLKISCFFIADEGIPSSPSATYNTFFISRATAFANNGGTALPT